MLYYFRIAAVVDEDFNMLVWVVERVPAEVLVTINVSALEAVLIDDDDDDIDDSDCKVVVVLVCVLGRVENEEDDEDRVMLVKLKQFKQRIFSDIATKESDEK